MDSRREINYDLPHLPKPGDPDFQFPIQKFTESTMKTTTTTSVQIISARIKTATNGQQPDVTSTGASSVAPDLLSGSNGASSSDHLDSKGLCCGLGGDKKPKVKMPVRRDAETYNMKHPRRGKAVIFNHENFQSHLSLSVRNGTGKDQDDLSNCLTNLGFEVTVYHDLTHIELTAVVRDLAADDHTENDCLLISVLTHGDTSVLYSKDTSYKFEHLWQLFTADRVPSLAGKPKIFFIQACQGDQLDGGTVLVNYSKTETDSHSEPHSYRIPNYSDFLITYATFPGHFAWRNTTNGSWFIQAICEVFNRHAENKDLMSMMTMVSRYVALTYESNTPSVPHMHMKKQIPFTTSTLIRDVFFVSNDV